MEFRIEQRVKELMSDILGLNPNEIEASTSMGNVAASDSLNHLNLCLAMEQEFGIALEVEEIESMLSYCDILDIVLQKV